ncbi:hypothetical protein Glove_149g119 [Diversispora epigaea]|uniref:Uncharacterized protein n=1 Tax=Diversispora epigaea TaxID=1348612 RepID=A0A397IWD1_9GLOM|nr:hypothetical protein Glove_149g119 [Diversispora epigaea]
MIGEYTCPFYHNSGKVCGRTCKRAEGCSYYWKAKKRVPCIDCGKPTEFNEIVEEESSEIVEEESSEIVEEESSNNTENTIHELFSRVFVNDSMSCASQVEKSYYLASIYPNVCIEYGNPSVSKLAKSERPQCNDYKSNVTNSKKCLRWTQHQEIFYVGGYCNNFVFKGY